MGQLTIQSFGFLKGFQEDIKIIIIIRRRILIMIIIIIITITITIIIASWLVRTLVASPQTSGSCRIYIYIALSQIEPSGITDGSTDAYSGSRTKLSLTPLFKPSGSLQNNPDTILTHNHMCICVQIHCIHICVHT